MPLSKSACLRISFPLAAPARPRTAFLLLSSLCVSSPESPRPLSTLPRCPRRRRFRDAIKAGDALASAGYDGDGGVGDARLEVLREELRREAIEAGLEPEPLTPEEKAEIEAAARARRAADQPMSRWGK